jgi:signal transduction histidine kinase
MQVAGMYRTILVATFLGLLALALSSAGLAWLGVNKARFELERTRLAHEVLESHQRLEAETYTLFKQLTDTFLTNGANKLDEAAARSRLEGQLDAVRKAIAREVAFVGDREDETEELSRLAAVERQISRVLEQFRAAQAVLDRGGSLRDVPQLDEVLDRAIDRRFKELMEAAIGEEQREVDAAHRTADATLARIALFSEIAAAAAVLLAIAALFLLLNRLRRPLEELVTAARAVATGDLTHRVPITGRDEFAHVGRSFNMMVEELAQSRRTIDSAQEGLETAIAQRTAELEGANATLKRADENRRRFLADISHELRTPLTIIRGEAEVTLRGRQTSADDYKTALTTIAEQAAQTGRLVDDLLFVARAEAGEPRLTLQAVALDEVLRRACADAEMVAEPKGVRIGLREGAREAVVQGDPEKLRQLAIILLDNAVRFSSPGGSVEVSLDPSPRGVLLRVADHGAGIAADEVGRVFERFYRGENAAARHPDGSGLGLPLAKAIAEAHGGEIAIESRVGEGTTVSVQLPVVRKLRVVA